MSLGGYFPFEPRAFWGDEHVRAMDGEQVAAYLRLLSHQWEEGSIPADPGRLAAILNDGARHFTRERVEAEIWPAVAPCFRALRRCDGRLVNERLDFERREWQKKRALAAKAGVASGKSRRRNSKAANVRSTNVGTERERPLNPVSSLLFSSQSRAEQEGVCEIVSPECAEGGAGGSAAASRDATRPGSALAPAKQKAPSGPWAPRSLPDDLASLVVDPELLAPVPALAKCRNLGELWEARLRSLRADKRPTRAGEGAQALVLGGIVREHGVAAAARAVVHATAKGWRGFEVKFFDSVPEVLGERSAPATASRRHFAPAPRFTPSEAWRARVADEIRRDEAAALAAREGT